MCIVPKPIDNAAGGERVTQVREAVQVKSQTSSEINSAGVNSAEARTKTVRVVYRHPPRRPS